MRFPFSSFTSLYTDVRSNSKFCAKYSTTPAPSGVSYRYVCDLRDDCWHCVLDSTSRTFAKFAIISPSTLRTFPFIFVKYSMSLTTAACPEFRLTMSHRMFVIFQSMASSIWQKRFGLSLPNRNTWQKRTFWRSDSASSTHIILIIEGNCRCHTIRLCEVKMSKRKINAAKQRSNKYKITIINTKT